MSETELRDKEAQLEAARAALFAKKEPIDEALVRNYKQLQKVREQIAALIEPANDLRALMDIDWSGGAANTGASNKLRAWMKEIGGDDFFDGDWTPIDLQSRDYDQPMYWAPKVKLVKRQDVTATIQALQVFATQIGQAFGIDEVRFDIFDSGLGQSRSPELWVKWKAADQWTARISDGYRRELTWGQLATGRLDEMTREISRRFYYESNDPADRDDYDEDEY